MTGVDIDVKVDGRVVERLYMEEGDTFEAEVYTDRYELEVVQIHD
jgi:hypothetical protein